MQPKSIFESNFVTQNSNAPFGSSLYTMNNSDIAMEK